MSKFIISSASVLEGKLEVHPVFTANSREDAITKAQDNIAQDFGYDSWEEYLAKMDPAITEDEIHDYRYTIYDCNCGHEEMYSIEQVK